MIFYVSKKKKKKWRQKPTKSLKNIKTFNQTLQYWKLGLPIYKTELYQKGPPKVRHTSITQKFPNWSYQLENIKCLQKNQQNLQKLLEY